MKRLLRAFVVFELTGNLAILAAHRGARLLAPPEPAPWGRGTDNAHIVHDGLWRSGRPSMDTYRAVAGDGAVLVVDLRAEGGRGPDPALGLEVLKLPIRDGQPPSPDQVARFREAVAAAEGPVLVHCSAGVGRTGSLVAAHRVLDRGVEPVDALLGALAVGPPSLEQLTFILGLRHRLRPPTAAIVLSRILDAPRRTWSRIRRALGSGGASGGYADGQPTGKVPR